MFCQFISSLSNDSNDSNDSNHSVYDIIPSSVDGDKILRVQNCVYIWFVISIISLGPVSMSLYLFISNTFINFLSISVTSIIFSVFSIIFIFSVYNFFLTHRYMLQLTILNNLTRHMDSLSIKNMRSIEITGDVSL